MRLYLVLRHYPGLLWDYPRVLHALLFLLLWSWLTISGEGNYGAELLSFYLTLLIVNSLEIVLWPFLSWWASTTVLQRSTSLFKLWHTFTCTCCEDQCVRGSHDGAVFRMQYSSLTLPIARNLILTNSKLTWPSILLRSLKEDPDCCRHL